MAPVSHFGNWCGHNLFIIRSKSSCSNSKAANLDPRSSFLRLNPLYLGQSSSSSRWRLSATLSLGAVITWLLSCNTCKTLTLIQVEFRVKITLSGLQQLKFRKMPKYNVRHLVLEFMRLFVTISSISIDYGKLLYHVTKKITPL